MSKYVDDETLYKRVGDTLSEPESKGISGRFRVHSTRLYSNEDADVVKNINTMKCIKGKCKYYQPDMFKSSIFRCMLEDAPFKIESDVKCVIEKTIVKTVDRLNKLREYKKEIERLNDEQMD